MLMLPLDAQYAAMPWDQIDTVVFDIGNVLVAFAPEEILQELFPDDPQLRQILLLRVFRSPCWVMLDRGSLTREQAAAAMAGLDERLRAPIAYVLENWGDLKRPLPEGVAALEACKARGKRCLALSNYHREGFELVRRKFDFFQLFDGFVISAHVGLLKPAPEIYRHLLAAYGLTGARTLFLDDTPANVEGALHCGLQGLCCNEPGKLRRFFGC